MSKKPTLRDIMSTESSKYTPITRNTSDTIPFGRITNFPEGSMARIYAESRVAGNYKKCLEELRPQAFPLNRESKYSTPTLEEFETPISCISFVVRTRIQNEGSRASYIDTTKNIWTSETNIERLLNEAGIIAEKRSCTKVGNLIFDSLKSVFKIMMEEDSVNVKQLRTIPRLMGSSIVPLKETVSISIPSTDTKIRRAQFVDRATNLIQYNLRKLIEDSEASASSFKKEIDFHLPRNDGLITPKITSHKLKERKLARRQEMVKEEPEEMPPFL